MPPPLTYDEVMGDETIGSPEFIERLLLQAFDETPLGVSDRVRWRLDPVAWAAERVRVELWSKQREILEAVRDERRVAVHSCHSVGKTFSAALVTAWWLDVHPPGTAFVVTTAPTSPQVKALLWREINRLRQRADLPGRTNLTEWYINNELVAFGRKPSDYNDSAFQGIHARHVLVIMDEAGGIPTTLWTAAESIAANTGSRILAIGNPDSVEGEFIQKCGPHSRWRVIHIGYAMTPAFTDEVVSAELLDLLISPEWVEERRAEWGEDSALFQSKVEGVFPRADSDPWRVIPTRMLVPCRRLELAPEEGEPVEAGIDVGGGGDRTVVFERRGRRAGRHVELNTPDPMAGVGQVVDCLNDWDIERAKIDVIGVGWGFAGRLRELSSRHNPRGGETTHHTEIVPVNFAERSSNPKRFLNKRAEVWWQVGREQSRLGLWDLGTLSDDVIGELSAPKYEIVDSSGRVKIEKKDEVIRRLHRSPDAADALLLAFYEGAGARPVDTSAAATFRQASLATAGGRSPFGSGRVAGGGFAGGGTFNPH